MEEEKRLISLLKEGTKIFYHKNERIIKLCGKPKYQRGEGKTDIYILLDDATEIKISAKKTNADFLQNKISQEWYNKNIGDYSILQIAIDSLKSEFYTRQMYYPVKTGRIEANSYTMGFRFDIVNKKSGKLCAPLTLTKKLKQEIFYGTNLPEEKRTVEVNGILIKDCGIANCLLFNCEKYNTAQDIINNICYAEDYQQDMFISFKAVNYRMNSDKIDGNRPLGVYINWKNLHDYDIIFNAPLQYGAKDILKHFKEVNNL